MNQFEIARALGLSQSAVSLVLNNPNTKRVSEEKKQKVLAFLKNDSYINEKISRKSWNIVFAVGKHIDKGASFFRKAFTGIERATQAANYSVFVDIFNGEQLNTVKQRKIDGVIFSDSQAIPENLADITGNLPVILLDCAERTLRYDTVTADHAGAVFLAVGHLYQLGHQRIKFLCGVPANHEQHYFANITERINGFYNAARHFKLSDINQSVELVELRDSIEDTEYKFNQVFEHWLQCGNPPGAVLCSNDFYASVLHKIALKHHLRVPENLSICGVDNVNDYFNHENFLTSIEQNIEEMAQTAAELLFLRLASSSQRPPRLIFTQSTLIIKQSTAQKGESCL